MITPEGDAIYLEFVELGPCNDFVREQVLPHFTMTDRLSMEEARARLTAWLTRQGKRLIIASDSEYDAKME